jgi:hypothetical protein
MRYTICVNSLSAFIWNYMNIKIIFFLTQSYDPRSP